MASLRLAAALLVTIASLARGQSEAACDSVIAGAMLDQTERGLYLAVQRVDGGALTTAEAGRMVMNIGSVFTAPRPFRLNVFSGPSLMRGLRSLSAATTTIPRAPTLTGTYRLRVANGEPAAKPVVVRQAMMPGFDSAAVEAIADAATIADVFRVVDGDSAQIDVTFSTDSLPGARRLASASFPRMPVIDAAPLSTNPPAILPPGVDADSIGPSNAVILRFVVTRDGDPAAGTVEVLRARSVELLRAALESLAAQRFAPATIKGCRVAQQVDYPFVFGKP